MSSFTLSSPFITEMLKGAVNGGHEIEPILRDAGLSSVLLQEPKLRITTHKMGELCRVLIAETQDIAMGLLDKPMKRESFKVLTYYLLHASNVREALCAFAEFMNLFENSFVHETHEVESGFTYRLARIDGSSVDNSFVVEYILVTLHRLCCWLTGSRIAINHVTLDYTSPSYVEEYRHIFLGAPVYFEQDSCAIVFESSCLDEMFHQDLDSLRKFLRETPTSLLTQALVSNDTPSKIRNWMEKRLSCDGVSPNLTDAAEFLCMNEQTLRRRLKAEGTSYHEIKQQVRRDAAINLLNNHVNRVEDIAYEVGFSEPSTFIRAFKGWTGQTPLAYRKSLSPKLPRLALCPN